VIVTGGHGVMGSWVCRELVRRDARVVVIDTRAAPSVAFPESTAVDTVVGDLRDAAFVRATMADRKVDRIIHLAAIIGEKAERDPALAIEVNALATARLLATAAELGVRRVIAMSTKGVLGQLAARIDRLSSAVAGRQVGACRRPSVVGACRCFWSRSLSRLLRVRPRRPIRARSRAQRR